MNRRRRVLASVALAALGACAAPSGTVSFGSMTIPPGGPLQAVSDVEGPYSAVRYRTHAVAIRLWPDSLEDGLAELTVIVTNGSWNTITLDVDHIGLFSNGHRMAVHGRESMLALSMASPGSPAKSETPREIAAARDLPAAQDSQARAPQNDNIGLDVTDPMLASAAGRASANRRAALAKADTVNADERRELINDWYLETVDIYPGDTGTGGISIAVPGSDAEMELRISIDQEEYMFPISYRTRQ